MECDSGSTAGGIIGRMKEHRYATKAVHSGKGKIQSLQPHVVPIYQTVNFEYENFDQKLRVSSGEEPGYLYTRYSNPTIDALNDAVVCLEGGDRAFSFASGMGAISAAIFALVKEGDHILASSVLYGGTYDLMVSFMPGTE